MPRVLRLPHAVVAEDVQPPVVGVSNLRHQSIRSQDGQHERKHSLQAGTVRLGQRTAVELREPFAGEKQFQHQPVVRHRRLVVSAVLEDLHLHLLLEPLAALAQPTLPNRQVGKNDAEAVQPDDVAQKVVAGDLILVLEIALDERADFEQRSIRVRHGV